MNRRTLLGAVATASVAVAGCLDESDPGLESNGDDGAGSDDGSPDGDESTDGYVECSAPFVDYDDLPDEIAAEVDVAFESGAYETDETPLYDRAVSEGTPLWTDGAPHDHDVERDGDEWRLSFERRTAYDSRRELYLSNDTDETVSVTVTITDGEDDPVVDGKQYTLDPDDEKHVPAVAAFGEYDVTIELGDGRERTDAWEVAPPRVEIVEGLGVSIGADELSVAPLITSYDYISCPMQWEEG